MTSKIIHSVKANSHKLIVLLTCAFFSFILWIIYLADNGANSVFFDFIRSFPYGDKVGHIGLFGMLNLLAIMASKFVYIRLGNVQVYLATLIVSVLVVIEELSQAFIATRSFDLIDLSADAIGILLATGFATRLHK